MKTHAFPLQLAQEAILLGRYPDAIELLRPLSDNHPEAQFLHSYLHFWDDKLSRTQALDRMTYLANMGHAEANYILAICPDLSPGYTFSLPKRTEQLNRLQTAANLGSINAIVDLAQCHIEKLISHSDLTRVRNSLEQAVATDHHNRKHSKLCFVLGMMYVAGIGGEVQTQQGLIILRATTYYALQQSTHSSSLLATGIDLLKKSEVDFALPDRKYLRGELDRLIKIFETMQTEIISGNSKTLQWMDYLQQYCAKPLAYDLRDADFDTLSDFIFDHFNFASSTMPDVLSLKHWNVSFNPSELLQFYTVLFQNPAFLIDRYSVEQIKQGFTEFITSRTCHDWSLGCLWSLSSTSIDEVEKCFHSMLGLFEQLFHRKGLIDLGHQWWRLGFGYCKTRYQDSHKDYETMRQIRLEVLLKILKLPSLDSQKAVIHALSYNESQKGEILQQYLDDHPHHPTWIRDYARQALEGRVP